MNDNPQTCYMNDDCRYDQYALGDCNSNATNKYYKCKEGLDPNCMALEIACITDSYFMCEVNICVKRKLIGR